MIIRRAAPIDRPAFADVARRSYARGVDRIGQLPAPMTADDEALLHSGRLPCGTRWERGCSVGAEADADLRCC